MVKISRLSGCSADTHSHHLTGCGIPLNRLDTTFEVYMTVHVEVCMNSYIRFDKNLSKLSDSVAYPCVLHSLK